MKNREMIIHYNKNPKFKKNDLKNDSYILKNSCNDEVILNLNINPDNIIDKIEWNGKGCFIALSVPEFLSENLINRDLSFAKNFILNFENFINDKEYIENENFSIFNIVKLQKQKIKCAQISIDLFKKRIME